MFLHTFYTWILSNLLHYILFIIILIITEGNPDIFDSSLFISAVIFFCLSVIISLPCLLLGWLCLNLINASPYSGGIKFLLWLVTGPSLVFFEFLFILVLTNQIENEDFLVILPAMTAAGMSILIRYRQFEKLNYTPKIDDHETNLV